MAPRDVIEACSEFKITCDQAMRSTLVVADQIVRDLADAGYVILPAAEVEAIQNKALEEAAKVADGATIRITYGTLHMERNEPIIHRDWIASRIRALKGAKPYSSPTCIA